MSEHDRFSALHRENCGDCHDAYDDFLREQTAEAELDNLIGE